LVPSQQLARQTDGLWLVVLHRAILQLYIHDLLLSSGVTCYPPRREDGMAKTCYTAQIHPKGSRKSNQTAFRRPPAELMPMSLSYLPTVIVRHSAENPRKCSVLPLRGRQDLLFLPYPVRERPNLTRYVRLSAEGPELSMADATAGILLLDGSWR